MAVRQPVPEVGRTHASSVMPVVRWSAAASATVTQALVPLKDSAAPYFPVAVHVAFVSVPVLPWPDASFACTPAPSLKPWAAPRPGGADDVLFTVTPAVAVPRLPAASRATAPIVWGPFEVVPVFHAAEYGGVTRSAPSAAPSSWSCTPATPTSSDAVAATV